MFLRISSRDNEETAKLKLETSVYIFMTGLIIFLKAQKHILGGEIQDVVYLANEINSEAI